MGTGCANAVPLLSPILPRYNDNEHKVLPVPTERQYDMAIIDMATYIAPSDLVPNNIPHLKVLTHWQVDDADWEENDLAALYSAPQAAPASIEGFDMELDMGVVMDDADAASVIAEVSGAITEFAENQRYYIEHESEYDGYEDAMMSEMEFQYDPNIAEAACRVLFGCSAQEMDLHALFALGNPDDWYEACNRTFTVS